MSSYLGPRVMPVDEVGAESFARAGRRTRADAPLLVRGALAGWPALERWTFDWIAQLRAPDGSELTATFQNGLIEQGETRPPLVRSIAEYAREITSGGSSGAGDGLLDAGVATLPAAGVHLRWSFLQRISEERIYLGQWEMLERCPQLAADFRIADLWPGLRSHWPSIWMGPKHTVTGLHNDYPDNWFCQIRGEKEFVLFAPEEQRHLSPSGKYDRGSRLSRLDIRTLHRESPEREAFAQARGWYARVRAGDALFIPKHTWHAVVALSPSLSLSVFGLTPLERLTGGLKETTLELLHRAGWYRRGNCTCHAAGRRY
jgi:lysine-specific demethylase 8